jgi:hypothetical protein
MIVPLTAGSAAYILAGQLATKMSESWGQPVVVENRLGLSPILPAMSFVTEGKLLALVVTTARRSPMLQQVPTVAETGLRGFDYQDWWGVFAPAGTPPAVVDKIGKEIVRVLQFADSTAHSRSGGATKLTRRICQLRSRKDRCCPSSGQFGQHSDQLEPCSGGATAPASAWSQSRRSRHSGVSGSPHKRTSTKAAFMSTRPSVMGPVMSSHPE